MKKVYLISIALLSFLIASRSFAQTQLSWRITDPRVLYTYNSATNNIANCLEFNVQVKASAPNSSFYTLSIILSFNKLAIDSLDFDQNLGFYSSGGNYTSTISENSGNLNIFITSLKSQTSPAPLQFSVIPTTWATVGRVRLSIVNKNQLPNIDFLEAAMDIAGNQQEKLFVSPWVQNYNIPSLYDPKDLTNLYLGRMYSNTTMNYGWSQVGGTVLYSQYVNWAQSENTSVWDSSASAATISGAASIANLRIHSGARLKILPGGQVTCTGATDINEPKGLWIASDATGTGSFIDNGTITYPNSGSAMVSQYLNPDKWHGYCIPVSAPTTRRFIDFYMKWYENSTHHYKYVIDPARTDSTMGPRGMGFMAWSASGTTNTRPLSPIGNLNTGSVTIPVYRSSYPAAPGQPYDCWNLAGNPYPSAIDLNSPAIDWQNTIQEAWFYNPSSNNFEAFIKAGGGIHSSIAPAQQAFFVSHELGSTSPTSLSFTDNSLRTHSAETFLKEDFTDMLWLNVTNSVNGFSDVGILRFAEGTTTGLDENTDALKIKGESTAPQLFFPVTENQILQVNVQPWTGINQVVPLSISFPQQATATLTATKMESFRETTKIFIEDLFTNTMQDLRVNPTYNFNTTAQDSAGRFLLHFYNPAFGAEIKNLSVFSFNGNLYVQNLLTANTKGIIQLYDLSGRLVFQNQMSVCRINKFTPGVEEGYYVARVITDDNVYTQKVYLR